MQYRINQKNGDKLSLLGFGCMRFSKKEEDTEQQILKAIELGVNYFDTAYIYPKSEATLGSILAKHNLRDKVKIATKLPPYLVKKTEDFDKILTTELKRLQTDYIDYYFMHMLTHKKDWERLLSLGVIDWITAQKKAGKIKNLGFSFHGSAKDFLEIIDSYNWDFCMLQYNFLDDNNQAGKKGLDYAHSKQIPIMVMEPLRGGRLVNNLPKSAQAVWDNSPKKRTNAEWAFRWVYNHPQVLTVLSGMNSLAMVEENVRIASETKPNSLTQEELTMYSTVKTEILKNTPVPCTGCNYCVPCPVGVDIPMCFACYNDTKLVSKLQAEFFYITRTNKANASLCIQCGKCESHCPQHIEIRKELKQVTRSLEGFLYKPMRFVVKKFLRQSH